MDRRSYLAGVASAGLVGLAGCLNAFVDQEFDVGMDPMSFIPETLTVESGTTVVWRNTSSRGHTVTAYEAGIPEEARYFASGGFETETRARSEWNTSGETGMLYSGEEFEHTFDLPGEYRYVCLPHERAEMVGTVVVEE